MKEMVLKRGMNRKGEDASPISMIAGFILIAVVVVVAILFFTGSFGTIGDYFKAAPPAVEARIAVCQGAYNNGNTYTYCDQFEENTIGPETQYVNCQYPAIRNNIQVGSEIVCKAIEAGKGLTVALEYQDRGKYYCRDLLRTGGIKVGKTKVNDVLCSDLSCSDLGGDILPRSTLSATKTTSNACDDNVNKKIKEILVGFKDSNENICCVFS